MESLDRRTRHVFLSPHLDDAVLSCGGLIAKAASLNCPVEVLTFYTAQPDVDTLPPTQREAAIYEQRKREDSAALWSLGATPIWLDHTERFLRPPWLGSVFHLFRTPSEGRLDEFPNAATIRQVLGRLTDECPEASVFAPLGVGNQHDHVELFLCSISTAVEKGALDRFVFYEDAYSLGTRMRRKHHVVNRVCWKWWQAPAFSAPRWFVISNVMASLRRGRDVLDYLPARCRRLRWSVSPESIQGFERKKLEALSMYETQVKALGGQTSLAKAFHRYHRFWGDAEPYWHAQQG